MEYVTPAMPWSLMKMSLNSKLIHFSRLAPPRSSKGNHNRRAASHCCPDIPLHPLFPLGVASKRQSFHLPLLPSWCLQSHHEQFLTTGSCPKDKTTTRRCQASSKKMIKSWITCLEAFNDLTRKTKTLILPREIEQSLQDRPQKVDSVTSVVPRISSTASL